MVSLNRNTLAGNAYRTLGLPATATQGAIDGAARRMRIWPDPARIPATPWDLPWLGPISRTRSDVEQAVARLMDPVQRGVERTLWYHGATAPADAAAALGLTGTDAAIGSLHAAIVVDHDTSDSARWREVLARWGALEAEALERAEADGGFEKRSTPGELRAAMATVWEALGHLVAERAQVAWGTGNGPRCEALVAALRHAGHARPVSDLIDRLEDELLARIAEADRALRDALRTDEAKPEPYYEKNLQASRWGAGEYGRRIGPPLNVLARLIGKDDPNRTIRLRARCADLLVLLALGWEWSGQPITAERTLEDAAELSVDTATGLTVAVALARVRPLAEAARERARAAQRAILDADVAEVNARLAAKAEAEAEATAAAAAVAPIPVIPLPPAPVVSPAKRRLPRWVDRVLLACAAVVIIGMMVAFQQWNDDKDARRTSPSPSVPQAVVPRPAPSDTVPADTPPLHVDPLSGSAGEVNRDPF